MKQINTKAILLKRINFSEADRVLTVITPEQGRLSMLAKGVRRQKSKLAGGIELFCESDITYIDGRSELKTIIGTRLVEHYGNIPKDVNKTMVAYDCLQAVYDITQHGVEQGVYEILKSTLAYLNEDNSDSNIAIIWFTLKLLKLDGAGINLEKPLNKDSFSDDDFYEYSYDDSSFFSKDNGKITPNQIKFLKIALISKEPAKLELIKEYKKLAGEFSQLIGSLLKVHRT